MMGPRPDPWGTLQETVCGFEVEMENTVHGNVFCLVCEV